MTENTYTTGHKIIVIGAGYAGLLAATHLAAQTQQQTVQITLVNATDRFVERIRLHQLAVGQRLPVRPLQPLLAGTGVQFVQGWVTAIQPNQKTISVQTSDQAQTLPYDTLVYAPGSQTDQQRIPGAIDHAYTLDLNSASKLTGTLAALNTGAKVLIIGAGLTGIETATEVAEHYPELRIYLLTSGTFGSDLSAAGQAYLRQVFAQLKITLIEQTAIRALEPRQALTGTDETVGFDVCIVAAGFTPSPLAQQAGFAVNAIGQMIVDPFFRSLSHPDVFAIGDSASLAENTGLSLRMACATAMPMAVHVAKNIGALLSGRTMRPFAFSYLGRCISLGRHRGLVQLVSSDDSPRDRVFTGRSGAIVKELLCRYTVAALQFASWSGKRYQRPRVQQPELQQPSQREVAI